MNTQPVGAQHCCADRNSRTRRIPESQIRDKKAFKEKYRQALNSLPIDDTTVEKIVAEANKQRML